MTASKPIFTQLPETMEVGDVGPYLRSLREHYKLNINDVAHRLHIRPKYIEAMEAGQFDVMPTKVYARGYIASYAEFLGVNPAQAVELCLGTAPEKKDEFFMPQRELKTQRGAPNPRVMIAALALCMSAAAAYFFLFADTGTAPDEQAEYQQMSEPAAEPVAEEVTTEETREMDLVENEESVSAVPEDLLVHTRQLLMPTGSLKRCLVRGQALACVLYDEMTPQRRSLVDAQFLSAPGTPTP